MLYGWWKPEWLTLDTLVGYSINVTVGGRALDTEGNGVDTGMIGIDTKASWVDVASVAVAMLLGTDGAFCLPTISDRTRCLVERGA